MLLLGIKRKAQTLLSVKTLKKKRFRDCFSNAIVVIKDRAYFCYCAHVLRISRYSGFLWVVRTNSGIFFARLTTIRRKQNSASALDIQKENRG